MQVNEPEGLGLNAAADDQDFEDNHGAPPPPGGVKITGYRVLNMSVVFAFGLTKGILTYMGQSAAPTTLDWVSGAVLAVILYWIGLHETTHLRRWEWFFEVDLTPAICYSFLRFSGGVFGVLLAIEGTLAITSLCSFPVFLLAHIIPRVSIDIWLVVYVCLTVSVFVSWTRISLITRRLRGWARGRQYVMGFLEAYGPGAALSEQHEWSGTVGATTGFLCGIGLVCSPLGFVYLSLSREADTFVTH